jgi:hypothetical protein
MNHHALSCVALTLVAGLSAMSAAAGPIPFHYQNAAGFCQAALPAFEGNLRKRPTAIANEGTSNAFVSCSLPGESAVPITSVLLRIYNRGAAEANVTCSLVSSSQPGGMVIPKTVTVPAASNVYVEWLPTDIGPEEVHMGALNFSCNLVPGTDINSVLFFEL